MDRIPRFIKRGPAHRSKDNARCVRYRSNDDNSHFPISMDNDHKILSRQGERATEQEVLGVRVRRVLAGGKHFESDGVHETLCGKSQSIRADSCISPATPKPSTRSRSPTRASEPPTASLKASASPAPAIPTPKAAIDAPLPESLHILLFLLAAPFPAARSGRSILFTILALARDVVEE